MHVHWLFITNAIAHLVASMSGLVSFGIAIYEALKQKKFETWAFFAIGGICLIVAFDQSWQDEHRNAQVMIGEKSNAVEERNFWKDQSYVKDETLRKRDELLSQNFGTLTSTQQALVSLSDKILGIAKPEPLKITVAGERLPYYGGSQPHELMMLAFPNKIVGQVNVVVKCNGDIQQARAAMLGHDLWIGGGVTMNDARSFSVNITSPIWTPTEPLVAYIAFKGGIPTQCTVSPE